MTIFEQYFPQASKYLRDNPEGIRAGTAGASSSGSELDFNVSVPTGSPPSEPDYSELTDQYNLVPQRFNSRSATKGLDDLITATKVMGSQQAQNAAVGYSNRLTQQGQNPVAAGVVAAQVQNASNTQVKDLTVQRDAQRMAAQKDAALVASGIADKIANIRDSYSKTLADFNLRSANLKVSASSARASNAISQEELLLKKQLQEAQLAQLVSKSSGATAAQPMNESGAMWDFDPGYITNSGPIIGARIDGKNLLGRTYNAY